MGSGLKTRFKQVLQHVVTLQNYWSRLYNALKDVDRGGCTKHSIAAKYGVKASALSNWISNRKAIEEAYLNQTFGPKRKRMRP